MISIANVVESIIIHTPFLKDAFERNLINYSGFARAYLSEIEEQTMKRVTIGAIVMALKRLNRKSRGVSYKKVFKKTPDVIVRSQMIELTVVNMPSLIPIQKKILQLTTEDNHQVMTITKGVSEITIIGTVELMNTIIPLYQKEAIISIVHQISAVTIKFHASIVNTPGVIHTILSIVAWKGINLIEVVSTYSELTLIVKHNDVDQVFSLIQRLFETK